MRTTKLRRYTVVALTGAGISAESGLRTFRESDGLWEGYRVEDVATPGAWHRDRKLVLDFYNERRRQVLDAQPNAAHRALAELESHCDVRIITQNIDDLHERAGSTHVLHLHGEILKGRSTLDDTLIIDLPGPLIVEGDRCPLGSQLRPHVVWFGEAVPMMDQAIPIVEHADELLIIGTSLAVYPAAGLFRFAARATTTLIDPKAAALDVPASVRKLPATATIGVPQAVDQIRARAAEA